MADDLQTPFVLYQNYYEARVVPKVIADMGECAGFHDWLRECSPELQIKINAVEAEIESLWQNRSEMKSFKAACQTWYNLLMEAKKGYEAHKARKATEAERVGTQERLAV